MKLGVYTGKINQQGQHTSSANPTTAFWKLKASVVVKSMTTGTLGYTGMTVGTSAVMMSVTGTEHKKNGVGLISQRIARQNFPE